MLGQRIEGVECFQESATRWRPTDNDAKPPFFLFLEPDDLKFMENLPTNSAEDPVFEQDAVLALANHSQYKSLQHLTKRFNSRSWQAAQRLG